MEFMLWCPISVMITTLGTNKRQNIPVDGLCGDPAAVEEELDDLEVSLRGRQVERRASVEVGDAAVVAEEHVAPQVVQVARGRRVHHRDDGVPLRLVQHPTRVLLVPRSPLNMLKRTNS